MIQVIALAGGVGGAKLAQGLYAALPPDSLLVLVNTADDFTLHGLRICPDLDTVLYTLAGLANPQTGWGIGGDTFATLEMLTRYGADDTWFQIGDRDFATHIRRTQRLAAGMPLSVVEAELARALDVRATLLPMADAPVATLVDTDAGRLAFQDYFVRRRHSDNVRGIVFDGIAEAAPPDSLAPALATAEAIVFCPSNPLVSIGPILAVPGLRDLLVGAPAPRVAVSPIVGGKALKGPADQMLATLGHEVSAYGVAALYQGLIDGMVIGEADAALAPRIADLGMRVQVAPTIMRDEADRKALAEIVLAFCAAIAGKRGQG
ncbi:MAG TPA: 2-phospho-L-lactate transferase [Chloroflexia bacterium]|nr:2-phospho-L-lactate transferase [Chloroflexia bacterium]